MPNSRHAKRRRWKKALNRARETVHIHNVIGEASVVIVAVGIIITAVIDAYKTISESSSGTVEFLSHPDIAPRYVWVTLLVFAIVACAFVGTGTIYRNDLKSELRASRNAAAEFRNLAEIHYECDRFLFERLFCELVDGKADPVGPIESSIQVIKSDINAVIESSVRIFKSYLREECCVTVMLADTKQNDRDPPNIVLKPVVRRGFKAAERGALDRRSQKTIDSNTANQVIFRDGKPFFVSSDLAGMKDGYINTRDGWEADYNSTIVWGIRSPTPALSPSPYYQGVLCVDTLFGDLDTPACKLHVEELSFRLAIMLYRLDKAEEFRRIMGDRPRLNASK